jgi:hypothetical protein
MKYYELLLGLLGTWRITHLLVAEDGPSKILVRMRRAVGDGFWGELLDCFYCLSLWVAALFCVVLGESFRERCLLWLALSGGAILLERITSRPAAAPPAIYFDSGDEKDGLLREEQSGSERMESGKQE